MYKCLVIVNIVSSRFCVGSRIRDETPEECWRIYRPKRCEENNADEANSLNILSDKKTTYCEICTTLNEDFKVFWCQSKDRFIYIYIKTKHPVHVVVFWEFMSNGDFMFPFSFSHCLRLNIKCLDKFMVIRIKCAASKRSYD